MIHGERRDLAEVVEERHEPGSTRSIQEQEQIKENSGPDGHDWIMDDLSSEDSERFLWPSAAGAECFEGDLSPASFFELFFDDEVLEMIVRETAHHGQEKGTIAGGCSIHEMRRFLAILLISGYCQVPRRRLYFSYSEDVRNDAICRAMSRQRFEEILSSLHLANNNQLDSGDKYAKVRPLLDALGEKFIKYFPIQQHLCVDESMVPYYGRHSGKMFLKGKPIRFGYKVWCCCTREGY